MLQIRKAEERDLEQIRVIYNDAILTGTATFDTELKSAENRKEWFLARDENFPILIAEKELRLIAYAALNKWSERKAYAVTAEVSLYVHADFRGKGVGSQLLSHLIKTARTSTNLHSLIARITEGNEQSIYLHQREKFEVIGVMKEAGLKFGKLHDVTFMQLMLRN
jgi:L-amino acid N-acyltransferase